MISCLSNTIPLTEEWKDIPGYEGIYEASSFGRIRTKEGKTTSNKRHQVRVWKSRILKAKGNAKTGYRVGLWKNNERKELLVARLVAMTFLGLPPEGYTVNHKDGNRFNNAIENLEWLSREDNIRHGFNAGLYRKAQKEIAVEKNGNLQRFPSCAALDRFLGRSIGYTSGTIIKGKPILDRDGQEYKIILKEQAS